jgi:hypothetical protein
MTPPMLLKLILDATQQVIKTVETVGALPVDDPRCQRTVADLFLLAGLQSAVGDFAHSIEERIAPGADATHVPQVVDLRLVTPGPTAPA